MSTEIDRVSEFMAVVEGPLGDLSAARCALEDAIAHEEQVTEFPKLGASRQSRLSDRRPLRWGLALSAAAVLAAVLYVTVPSTQVPMTPAAAAEISRLADAVPTVPPLAPGQWYQYQLRGALSAHVTSGTTSAPIAASATIPIAIGEWSNATTALCTSEQFGTATFATAADSAAWGTLGLLANPTNQPATGCSAGVEASMGGGGTPFGPVDVANIAHDPATLARQLQEGTTGISQVDAFAQAAPAHTGGFLRLTDLLVGPLKGQWSGFGQEMLQTMALLPGIDSLGTMTTHEGALGPAFSMSTQVTLNASSGSEISTFTPPTVILDPRNGALLEVRNLDYPVLGSAAQDFVASPTALVYSDGVSYGTTAEWIDPVSGLQVIRQNSVPGWIATYHIIEAVSAPSTTPSQLSAAVNPYLGNGNEDYSDGSVNDITIMGTLATAQGVADSLTASGLFVSVSLKL